MNSNTKTKYLLFVLKRAFSVILTLILCACLIFVVYSVLNGSGNGVFLGPYQFIVVVSGSMEPTLSTGSLAVVQRASENELSIGDIITYKPFDDQTLVTHRITNIIGNGNAFTTKGDNNNTEDRNSVPYKSVIGKVVFWLPFIGYLFIALKTPPGIIILVAIILLYELIRHYSKKINKAKRGEYTNEKTN